jgi:energy-coupling factor transporter ATP-binding protein EcfA2
MLNALLSQAVAEGASDVHVEPFEASSVVRYRVDGVLRDIVRPRRALHAALVSRLKIMASLDIAEKRLPQDGRIVLRLGGRPIDVRVSTLPTGHGERVVLRLLDKERGRLEPESLGMSAEVLAALDRLVKQPHGIVLVTGPTGSGKTTTLYAMLSRLDAAGTNIMTVEDPIEYDLAGIGQTQVNARIDMTFARALRAILRQDPDVIMIGEIRDQETAQIAVQASLTGHLVLTPTTRSPPSRASSTWGSSRSCSPPRSSASSRSAWCASSAPTAAAPAARNACSRGTWAAPASTSFWRLMKACGLRSTRAKASSASASSLPRAASARSPRTASAGSSRGSLRPKSWCA